MIKHHIVIKGNKLDIIMKELQNNINEYYLYENHPIYIFFSEKYYFRTMSDMMTGIVINYYEENSCDIEIISGGGTDGITDWGSESDRNTGIYDFIDKLAKRHDWDIVRESI